MSRPLLSLLTPIALIVACNGQTDGDGDGTVGASSEAGAASANPIPMGDAGQGGAAANGAGGIGGVAGTEGIAGASPLCPSDKLSFTRDTACQNDGFVEFCLPADDVALQARALSIAPTLTWTSSRGRAGCDAESERLYQLPMSADDCAAPGASLSDATWATICELAALPEVRRIVPTLFE